MTSLWARWRVKSPVSRMFTELFVQSILKKAPKLRVTGLCEGNSPVTGEFPTQRTSNAQNDSIWWRHHDQVIFFFSPTRYPPGSHIKGRPNKQIRPAWGPVGFYISRCMHQRGVHAGSVDQRWSAGFWLGGVDSAMSPGIYFLSIPTLCLHLGLGRRSQQCIKPNIQSVLWSPPLSRLWDGSLSLRIWIVGQQIKERYERRWQPQQ